MVIVIYENVTAAEFRFRSARPPPRHLQIAIWVNESQINCLGIPRIFMIYCGGGGVCVWTQYECNQSYAVVIQMIIVSNYPWCSNDEVPFLVTSPLKSELTIDRQQRDRVWEWTFKARERFSLAEKGNRQRSNCKLPLFCMTLLVVELFKAKPFRFNWPLVFH